MSDAQRTVTCIEHGDTPATYVCHHLLHGVGCGFHASEEDADDPWPDAWCDACEAIFQRDGEWNESNEPELALLCTRCYERARARNLDAPAPIRPGQVSFADDDFAALARAAFERAAVRQERAKARWGIGEKKRWFYDDETRTMRFYDDPNGEAVVADVVITGSFSTRSSTWLWAWGNEDYPDDERALVDPVRVFGEVRGIEKLAQAHWRAEEVDGWEVTQIAADLLGAEAIYRAPFDDMLVFMLLNDLRIVQPS